MGAQRPREGPRLVVIAGLLALGFSAGYLLAPRSSSGSGNSSSGARGEIPIRLLGGPGDGSALAAATRAAPAAAAGGAGARGLPGTPAWRAAARANLSEWRETLFARAMTLMKETARAASPHAQLQPKDHARYNLFSAFLTCPGGEALSRVGGSGDGGKLACPSLLKDPDCVVYSLGSAGNFKFENDILKSTGCKVVSFDCTSGGHTINERHTFVRKCLGSEERMRAEPARWVTLGAAMKEYRHTTISLLKIDIEGFELDVLSKWRYDGAPLPQQVAVELHYKDIYSGTPALNNPNDFENLMWPPHQMSLADLALFVGHLGNMGYGIVSREDNAECPYCSELTLLRVDAPGARA